MDDSNYPHATGSPAEFTFENQEATEQIFAGRYRVLSVLGKGGMGVVYRVEQIFLGKELALKTIDKKLISEITIRRFQHEARVSFALDHPNIISVNDFALLDDDTPYLVMELLHGCTLAAALKKTGRLPYSELLPIFVQVCFGLAHAHQRGVMHRDIKPSNIMLIDKSGSEGSVKILDFGIAKFAQHEGGELQALTRTGEIFGSPLYMSPEQCLGTGIDHRTDIYSLGCVMFEALAGTTPFVSESALSTMMMHQTASVPTLKEASLGENYPPELERIVQTMLAKNPDERYQNLGTVAHELAAILRGESLPPQVVRPVTRRTKDRKSISMSLEIFILVLAATFVLGVLITLGITQLQQTNDSNVHQQSMVTPPAKDSTFPTENSLVTEDFKRSMDAKDFLFVDKLNLSTDSTLLAFRGYKYAQLVTLSNSQVTDRGIANLQQSKILELEVENCKNIVSVDNISKLQYLQDLNLSGTGITDAALDQLASLKMLAILDLSRCKVTEKGLRTLIRCATLDSVTLTPNAYKRSFVQQLRDAMPQCRFPAYFDKSKLEEACTNWRSGDDYAKYSYLTALAATSTQFTPFHCVYLNALADTCEARGQLAEANALRTRNFNLVSHSGNIKLIGQMLLLQSAMYYKQKNYKQTLAKLKQGIPLLMDTIAHNNPYLITCLNNGVALAKEAGDLDTFEYLNNQAVRLLPKDVKPEELASYYERVGWAYWEKGNRAKAYPYLKKNLDVLSARPGSLLYVRALIEIGHTHPDPEQRQTFFKKGLQILDAMPTVPDQYNLQEHYCDACFELAVQYKNEGKKQECIKYVEKALDRAKHFTHEDLCHRKAVYGNALNEWQKQFNN